ncbi:MAG: hydrogenase maturation protease [bacterium]|nr:hydrogenase maturation protease [bacterium]
MKTLLLGLGNDLITDDGAGIAAVRELREELKGLADVDIEESSMSGMALLELFLDYDRAIIIDAVHTTRHPPGSILEWAPEDLGRVISPSPHYAGLPEMLTVAEELQLNFPEEIKIFGLEVVDPYTIGEGLSQVVREAIPALKQKVIEQLEKWRYEVA